MIFVDVFQEGDCCEGDTSFHSPRNVRLQDLWRLVHVSGSHGWSRERQRQPVGDASRWWSRERDGSQRPSRPDLTSAIYSGTDVKALLFGI